MSTRWAIANDPKLLARIAQQESQKGRGVGRISAQCAENEVAAPKGEVAKRITAACRAKKVAEVNQDSRRDTLSYDKEQNTLTIVLAGAELLANNVALRIHNAKLTKLKKTWQKRIEALMLLNIGVYDAWKTNQANAFPLIVEEVYATAQNNCLDNESVTAACKPIIDALVSCKFIPDDSPKYIAQPIPYTFRQQNSGLILVLRPALKPWGVIDDRTIELARTMPSLPAA